LTGSYPNPALDNARLHLFGKVCGRYGESVGAIEVIDRQEKSVVHVEVTGRYAN
jgi:hypothetical protein